MHTESALASDAAFKLLNTFYAPYADGIDLVHPVVTRTMPAIDKLRRTGDRTTGDDDHDEAEEVDCLVNIDELMQGSAGYRPTWC